MCACVAAWLVVRMRTCDVWMTSFGVIMLQTLTGSTVVLLKGDSDSGVHIKDQVSSLLASLIFLLV